MGNAKREYQIQNKTYIVYIGVECRFNWKKLKVWKSESHGHKNRKNANKKISEYADISVSLTFDLDLMLRRYKKNQLMYAISIFFNRMKKSIEDQSIYHS